MKLNRHAYFLVGFIPCLLFLSIDTAYSQVPRPVSYVFVEVRDVAGELVSDATVTVFDPGGTEIRSHSTYKEGTATIDLFGRLYYKHYTLKVSKSGYLTSEHAFFFYPSADSRGFNYGIEELPVSAEDLKDSKALPIKIELLRTPVTTAERQTLEVEERKRRLLLAAKTGDAPSLLKLLEAGVRADVADSKGAPAIAWAAFAGDAESITGLLAAGADVRSKGNLGHQALLIYLAEGISRASSEKNSPASSVEIVRKLIEAGAGINAKNSYMGTVLNNAIAHVHRYPSLETIKSLIAAGADVNAADGNGQTALMLASELHSAELTKMLLDAGAVASVNAKDNHGKTALMYSSSFSESSAPDVAKVLIAAAADVNAVNEDRQTALMLATQARSIELVRTLLESKASIDAKDKNGLTALMYASQSFNADIGRVLVQAGASVNEKDARGWTALMLAAPRHGGHSGLEIIEVLLAAGANVNDVNEDGQTALMLAARQSDDQMIKLLIEAGASINAKDKQGQTVLMHACQSVTPVDVKLLIKAGAGAFVNQKDARGSTALMYAVPNYYASKDAAALIAAGANVNAANDDGQTALMLAAETGSVEIVKLLLESGAVTSINAKDKQGRTTLMYVKPRSPSQSALEVVKALIAAGANVNAANNEGRTPLMVLPERVQSDSVVVIMKTLLQAGASINAKDKQGRTALIVAAGDPWHFDIRILIQAGAKINIADNDGRTALMVAAAVGGPSELEISVWLLKAGAQTNLADKKGRTALDIAKEGGHLEIVRLLQAAGARR